MISVIIPCYNCEAFIRRSVGSVLSQSFQDYELLLIDNGSTDGTLQILHEYRERYPGSVSVLQESSKGGSHARNKGLKYARGKWLQFLDADDELSPYKLASQFALAEDSDADVVVGDYVQKLYVKKKCYELIHHANRSVWKGLILSELGKTSSNLWKRSALLKVGGWNTNQTSSQEYELMFRLLQNNAYVVFDSAVLTIVHYGVNSVSKSSDPERLTRILQNRINLRMKIRDYLASTRYLTKEVDQLIDTYIYQELKTNYRKVPDYASSFLERNRLDVPAREKLKIETGLLKEEIKAFINRVPLI